MTNEKIILIVEDEKPLMNALFAKLTKEGYGLLRATDGEEGLKMALKKKPDLILTDIIMPVMDGITMLGHLREDDWGKNVPVIILTNLSDEIRLKEAQDNNVNDYLVKSDWKISDVAAKVKEKIG